MITNKHTFTPGAKSALELLQQEKAQRSVYTFSHQLDMLLGSGIRMGEITEFCGVPGIGKTQLGMQIACNAALPKSFEGTEGGAVYIDTEGSFLSERVAEIAQGLVDHIHGTVEDDPRPQWVRPRW